MPSSRGSPSTQGSNLSALQADSLLLSPQGSPQLVLGIIIQPQAGIWLLLSSPETRRKNCVRLWYLISILLCLILLLTAAYHLLKILLPPYCPGLWTQTRKGPEPFFSVQETEPLTVAHRSQMLSLGAQHRLSVIFSNYCPFNLIPYYKTEVIMCTHGWFMSMYGNNHHNIVNKLSSN